MGATILALAAMAVMAPTDTIRVGHAHQLTLPTPGVDTVDTYMVADGERQHVAVYIQTVVAYEYGYQIVQENRRP